MKTTGTRKDDLNGRGGAVVAAERGSRLAHGGKTVYGARIGILMLDTHFPRVLGDIGNAMTWPFPVLYRVIRGATPQRTNVKREEWILDAFVSAGKELVADGADGITTSCGFLSLYQARLAADLGVPVAASSLMQIPFVQALLPPGKRVGVITANSKTLGAEHLRAAGADPATPIVGAQEVRNTWPPSKIPADNPVWDIGAAEEEMLIAGEMLARRAPDLGAVVLECTNMPPFARALSEHLRLPVFDIYSFICWFHAGIAPRDFGHPGSAPRPFRER